MRGVYHNSFGIEAFLRGHRVAYPRGINQSTWFKGKGTEIFWGMMFDGPGRPPTAAEFCDRYMAAQAREVDTPGNRARMVQQYIGFMRDYHAGAMLLENARVSSVFWDATLDADCGIDYIVSSSGRYAAVRVVSPHGPNHEAWLTKKARRKSHLKDSFPLVLDLRGSWKNLHGGVALCDRGDVGVVQEWVAADGSPRPPDERLWKKLELLTGASVR